MCLWLGRRNCGFSDSSRFDISRIRPATITSSTTSTSSTPVPYVTGGSPGPIAIDGENNLWVGIVPTSTATGALALQTSASNYLNIYENQIEQNTHAFDDIVVDGSTSHLAVGFDSYTTTSGYFYRSSIATATTSTNLGSANLLDVGGPTALGTLWGTVDASNNIWVGEGTRGTGSIAHYVPNAATPISITACSSSGVNLTFTYSGTQLLKGEYVVPTGLTGAICSTANGLALVVRSTSLSATVFTAVNPTGGTGTQANVTGLTATGTQSTETITTGSIAAGTGSTAAGGIDDPASISIDGGGFVWIGNATTASGTTGGISEFTPSGTTAISPTLGTAVASVEGFNADGSTGVQDVTIDLSGNIWTGSNNSTFIHMFGAAEPVICPTSVATTSGVFPVASYSIDGSNNITVTFTNTLTSAFNTSDVISLSAFGTSTFLNGATLTVASASTTSATGVLSVTHATTSGTITEAGNTVDFTQPGRLGTRP